MAASQTDSNKASASMNSLVKSLKLQGLDIFGAFVVQSENCDDAHSHLLGRRALLVGNIGGAMWEKFSKSPEYLDNIPDPMNRWTERVLGELGRDFGAETIYPFGETVWPFQQFAKDAMATKPSPLGILIHHQYGLWHAFRGALVVGDCGNQNEIFWGEGEDYLPKSRPEHPCDACQSKPCITACPVSAFSPAGLDVEACYGHLDSGAMPHCSEDGCRARNACPVGLEFRYKSSQIQFHMSAFRGKTVDKTN